MVINYVYQVKRIEKRDSVLTSKQQIERLLRPGASYFNLNPFEVTGHTMTKMNSLKIDKLPEYSAISLNW